MVINNKKAFTLVELIVVITILAILGTIAFISMQGYSKTARDSVRISDIQNMEKSLELFILDTGYYPEPTLGIEITYSGAEIWTQGTIGDSVFTNLERLNKKPIDPITEREYTYSRLNTKNEYEIGAILEGYQVANNVVHLMRQTHASSEAIAYIKGTYNGIVAKVSTGSQLYVLAVPSIINGDISVTNYNNILTGNTLVINGEKNLPSSYKSTKFEVNSGYEEGIIDPVIYNSGNTLPSNEIELNSFITALQSTYSTSNVRSGNINILVNAIDNNLIYLMGQNIIKYNLGGINIESSGKKVLPIAFTNSGAFIQEDAINGISFINDITTLSNPGGTNPIPMSMVDTIFQSNLGLISIYSTTQLSMKSYNGTYFEITFTEPVNIQTISAQPIYAGGGLSSPRVGTNFFKYWDGIQRVTSASNLTNYYATGIYSGLNIDITTTKIQIGVRTNTNGSYLAYVELLGANGLSKYITTNDSSQVDISNITNLNSIGINSIESVNTSINYLVSFDGRTTWKYRDGANWVESVLSNINGNGMSKSLIESLTSNEWSGVGGYEAGITNTLDFAINFSTNTNLENPELTSINVNVSE